MALAMLRLACLVWVLCVSVVHGMAVERAASAVTLPGRSEAHAQAPAQVIAVRWEQNLISEIVVTALPFDQQRVLAYISTWQLNEQGQRRWQVIHLAAAFVDQQGDLHLDARGSQLRGPEAFQWLPDSFLVPAEGAVRVLDDADQAGIGLVEERFQAADAVQRHRLEVIRMRTLWTNML